MASRNEKIAQHIARAIVRNSRKRWPGLHSDALSAIESEAIMSSKSPSSTTTSMNVADSPAVREPLQTSADLNAASAGVKSNASGAAGSGVTSGMGVEQNSQVRPISVKPVDSKTLSGSYPGDHRANPGDVAKPSLDKAADNGGPRNAPGQFPLSGRTPAAPAPQSFLGAEGSDQN